MMGSAVVYVIGPLIVSTQMESKQDPYVLRHRIMYMLYVCKYKY